MSDIDLARVRALLLSDGAWHAGREPGVELFERDGETWWRMRADVQGTNRPCTICGPLAHVLALEIPD